MPARATLDALSAKPADKSGCPAEVAELLRFGGLDPAAVGDDWLDVMEIVGMLTNDLYGRQRPSPLTL